MCRRGPELDAIWVEVEDRVDRAGVGFTERLLAPPWSGVRSGAADRGNSGVADRCAGAVGLIVAAVVLVSRAADVGEAFLVLAPVVPTALVALSFASGCGSGGGVRAGDTGVRVRAGDAPGCGGGGRWRCWSSRSGRCSFPSTGLEALGWLLPALALSLGTLAGSAAVVGAAGRGWLDDWAGPRWWCWPMSPKRAVIWRSRWSSTRRASLCSGSWLLVRVW